MPAETSDSPSPHAAARAGGQPEPPSLSPLQRLPTELKVQIISYVIPHGLTIVLTQRRDLYDWKQNWSIHTCETNKAWESLRKPAQDTTPEPALRAFMALVLTSKDISTEARGKPPLLLHLTSLMSYSPTVL